MDPKGRTIISSRTSLKSPGQVIDGFVRNSSQNLNPKRPTASQAPKTHSSSVNKVAHPTGKTPAQALHSRTEKAHTLMRGALKRPKADVKAHIQRLTPGLNPQREIRAKTSSKNSRVDRFGSPTSSPNSANPQVVNASVVPRGSARAAAGHSIASTAVALPSMITSASHQKLERMLDEALVRADSHKQALRYQAAKHFWQRPGFLGRRAGLKICVIILAAVAAVGIAAWEKLPQFSVKVAGAQSHVSASVPSYVPDGYSLAAPATAKDGAVLLNYKSVDDVSSSYAISQKQSNMASASLAQTVVPQGSQVQTSQVAGNTVYIYGQDNNAAWVNNGVLYSIQDHARLSSDEIIKIVQGLN